MKYIFAALLALVFVSPIQAQENGEDAAKGMNVMRNPILMDYGASPLLSVVFNHSNHKGIKCRLCHHKKTGTGERYVDCTVSGCHSEAGARKRDPKSMFMAYHAPAKRRSCYGCHKMEAASHPEFIGCRPCHEGKQERKVALEQH